MCGDPPVVEDPDLAFQRDVGLFLSVSMKGFRGFDFGSRLTWEGRFGACAKPLDVETDALDAIFAKALETGATVGDVVLAVKDRVVSEPVLRDGEPALLGALLGVDLTENFSASHQDTVRLMCGALLSSPQHLLGGLPALGGEPTRLGPTEAESCAALQQLALEGIEVQCVDGALQVNEL